MIATRGVISLGAAIGLTLLATPARADRPLHGGIAGGAALLLTGDRGDRQRFELEADLEPHSRYGALIAWRGFDGDHRGVVSGGLIFEAAAARPVVVLALHGDLGVDLDQRAPAVGAGIRTTLRLIGPVGIALDSGAYLVLDGVDDSRLALSTSALVSASW